MRHPMSPPKIVSDGEDIYVHFNGKVIAKRGRPNTPQAGTWISLEPGYTVSSEGQRTITIMLEGARVH